MNVHSWLDDPFMTERPQFFGAAAAVAVLPVALCVVAGLMGHQRLAGMLAAGGAMSVGFGAFQRLGKSRLGPMMLASFGMGLSAFAGTAAHLAALHFAGLVVAVLAALWSVGGGLLSALGPGALWMGQQWVIAFLLAAAYPATPKAAGLRALLTVTGGLLQTFSVWLLWRWLRHPPVRDTRPAPGAGVIYRLLRRKTTWTSPSFRYSVRLGVTVFVAIAVHRLWSLPNGAWIPITTVLVLKPDFNQTFDRARLRTTGTMVGAGLSTLLAATLRPGPVAVATWVILFAWLTYSLQKVHYALFVMSLTAYIVFLFSIGGLPEKTVVAFRILNTAIGSLLALVAYAGMPRSTDRRSRLL